jgi:hypothetical protein
MRIAIYADNTLGLPVASFCDQFTATCSMLTFTPGAATFRVTTPTASYPSNYSALSADLVEEAEPFDLARLATAVAYETNYFFEARGSLIIVSFSGWNVTADLPVTNGLAYIGTSIAMDHLGIGIRHQGTWAVSTTSSGTSGALTSACAPLSCVRGA